MARAPRERAGGTARIAIIKVGSSTLTGDSGRIEEPYLVDLARQIHAARAVGWRVVLVSSGSIPAGLETLGLPVERPRDMPTVQAAASVGQRALLSAYDKVFSLYGITISLVLLTRRDTADRHAYLHARDTFRRLLELGVVPIVNENDTVSVEQIRFGDNDTLAALVACMIDADRVVILSDIDGLYTANPQTDPDARLLSRVTHVTSRIMEGASGPGSTVGSGGMVTKLTSARVLEAAGIPLVICQGRATDAVASALADEPSIGTFFEAREKRHEMTPRKLWIALGNSVKGRLIIDEGAACALVEGGSSLLGVGVVDVVGEFAAGDVIDVATPAGGVLARGLAKVSSEAARIEKGIVVHRDELVVFE